MEAHWPILSFSFYLHTDAVKIAETAALIILFRVALTSVTRQEVQFLRIISQMHEQGLRKQNVVCLDSYIAATALHAHS